MAIPVSSRLMVLIVSSLLHHSVQAFNDEQANPSMALLEFLGQWTDEHGSEIDFELFEKAQLPEPGEVRQRDRSDRPTGDPF